MDTGVKLSKQKPIHRTTIIDIVDSFPFSILVVPASILGPEFGYPEIL
jgi:hypothetical protein